VSGVDFKPRRIAHYGSLPLRRRRSGRALRTRRAQVGPRHISLGRDMADRLNSQVESRTRRGVVIFDADDTLWETQPLYEKAKQTFARKMAHLGFGRQEALTLLEDIDAKNASLFGFSRRRFPRSMVQTYRQLCGLAGRRPRREVEKQVRAIGECVFRVLPEVYPGTRRALRALRRQFRLVLATKGDAAVQTRRIEALKFKLLFDRIYLLRKKDSVEYRRIIRDLRADPKNVYVVGDSIRSDVNPALELGIRAFWIPRLNWAFEHAIARAGARRVSSVVEVANRLVVPERKSKNS
jgi:putative hydrolase of the HAD superfamily